MVEGTIEKCTSYIQEHYRLTDRSDIAVKLANQVIGKSFWFIVKWELLRYIWLLHGLTNPIYCKVSSWVPSWHNLCFESTLYSQNSFLFENAIVVLQKVLLYFGVDIDNLG